MIARATSGYEWVIGSAVFVKYHLLFVLSSLGRFASILLLKAVREPRAVGIPTTLSYVGAAIHHRLAAARQVFPEWARLLKEHDDD